MKTTVSIPILLLLLVAPGASSALAQVPVLEFESPVGFGLGFKGTDEELQALRDRFDLTGDGIPEVLALLEDDQGNPETYAAYDLTTRDLAASLPYGDVVAALDGQDPTRFLGFFSFYEKGNKAAGFRADGVLGIIAILIGKQGATTTTTLAADQVFLADIDGDELVEAVVRNPETKTVQVWGTGETGTATEAEIEAALFRLFQNYPNPFQDQTTITYEVERAGPVTVTVYDLLGRRVRTLIDETQPAGAYQVGWDGRDAAGQPVASGTYFYRLRVGEAVSSKQALRIK